MTEYRVVDLMSIDATAEIIVQAGSPEGAAKKALGLDLVRSVRNAPLRAKVYNTHPGSMTTMVRLYLRASDRHAEAKGVSVS